MPTWRLQTALVAIALLAILLSGFVQIERARDEEHAQRRALMRTLPLRRVRKMFGPLGIEILKGARGAFVARLRGQDGVETGSVPGRAGEPTGSIGEGLAVGPEFAVGLSRILLDGSHEFSGTHVSTPEILVRLRDSRGTLDVLFGHRGSIHLDVRALVRDPRGVVTHRGGPCCVEYAPLRRLLGDAFPDDP